MIFEKKNSLKFKTSSNNDKKNYFLKVIPSTYIHFNMFQIHLILILIFRI